MTRPRHPAGDKGFTMTELLVVVGIIAILSAVSLPNLIGYFRAARIRAAADVITGAIQKARNTAITRNSQMGVVFVTQNNTTFWVHVEDTVVGVTGTQAQAGSTRQALNPALPPNPPLTVSYTLPAGIQFATGPTGCPNPATYVGYTKNGSAIRFDRYGVPSVPGVNNAPALAGTPGNTNQFYNPAAPADFAICIFDSRFMNGATPMYRRALRISRSGRVIRD